MLIRISENAKLFFIQLISHHEDVLNKDEFLFYYDMGDIVFLIIDPIRDKSFITSSYQKISTTVGWFKYVNISSDRTKC